MPRTLARHEVAQDDGLADRAGHRALEIVSGAWPAEFADHDFLSRIRRPQLVIERQRSLDRGLFGHAFPVGKDVGEDFVHGVDEFRMIDEGLPVIRGRHGNRAVALHAPNDFDELGRGVLVPQIGFIAHHQPGDVMVAPGEIEGGGNLALVSCRVLVEPDAERDRETELGRDLRNALQALRRCIGAHRPGVFGNLRKVGANLRFRYPQAVGRRFGEPVVGTGLRPKGRWYPDFSAPRIRDADRRRGRRPRQTHPATWHGAGHLWRRSVFHCGQLRSRSSSRPAVPVIPRAYRLPSIGF